ncbi:hypothetical protein LJC68_02290 [Bacteroidales bacterium OttesenSCG-928-B11]|nr:hypothetical protein [Bacteroidales bacterium OttesenSCG-928-B11]MDL2325738.1 hypothetical protein [Bacteroidales bacterium OttesenSCG-928-A14]
MNGRKIYGIITLSLLIMASGCGDYVHPTIPNVHVDFTIYPNDPNYPGLNYFGGHEYFTGGVNGIVIYRIDYETFAAYDRACPYDWENPDAWICVDPSGLVLIDSCCGSRFNILDGLPINGPSELPLKYYKTRYNGNRLRIYS